MPYAERIGAIYRLIDNETQLCYVGCTRNFKKRIKDHFCLLRKGEHPNPNLQQAYSAHPSAFSWEMEVTGDFADLAMLENAFLSGEAKFDTPCAINIALSNVGVMKGRKHTEATKEHIRAVKKTQAHLTRTPEHRATLREAQLARYRADPEFVARLRYVLNNDHLTYAERARHVGRDITSVRTLYLRNKHLKGVI